MTTVRLYPDPEHLFRDDPGCVVRCGEHNDAKIADCPDTRLARKSGPDEHGRGADSRHTASE